MTIIDYSYLFGVRVIQKYVRRQNEKKEIRAIRLAMEAGEDPELIKEKREAKQKEIEI